MDQISATQESSPPEAPASWLLVEDDRHVARAIDRFLSKFGSVSHAVSVESALEVVARATGFCGLVLDVRLPDGSGLDVLRELRARGCEAPALVMTAHNDRENISEAQLLGAQFLWKPWSNENLRAFVNRALDWRASNGDLSQCLAKLTAEYQLSTRESDVVRLVTVGWPVEEIPRVMDLSANTVKTTVRRLLQKTNAKSVADLARSLHRQLLNPRQ